jgi:nitroreductase
MTGMHSIFERPEPQDARDTAAEAASGADGAVVAAVVNRFSVRRFLPEPVPLEVIRAMLSGAARAPSGTNYQPWFVHVVTGAARHRLSQAVLQAAEAGEREEEYPYAPEPVVEPYLSRKRRVGYALYERYGIARDDYPARKRAMLRNFEFFGAPVGLFFTMDRSLLYGSWLDCGMFMQNVMILARAFGLETCPQQAWCEFGKMVHAQLNIPDSQVLISGMAVGKIDRTVPENALVTEREPVDGFSEFHDE